MLVFGLTAHIVGTGAVDGAVYLGVFAAGCLFSYLLSLTPLALSRVRATAPRPLREILVFITPLVLLLAGAATGTIGSLDIAAERVVDTLVGAALGAASGVLHPRER